VPTESGLEIEAMVSNRETGFVVPGDQIKVHGSRHIHSIVALEQPELCSDARIEVEKLVASVSQIKPIIDVHNAHVADRLHEAFHLPPQHVVALRLAQGSEARVDGKRSQLSAVKLAWHRDTPSA
jgi:hypothetical protein